MNIIAEITGIKYKPLLCKEMKTFDITTIENAISKNASFLLKIDKNLIAVSWWVSPKRTRSYPYARVYNTLSFPGKKVTIIPIMKDEGRRGDRDFLQWDTISLMSLLGIYVIISYYQDASRSLRYRHKITKQKFNFLQIRDKIKKLLIYWSDSLHWNLSEIDEVGIIAERALDSYTEISKKLDVDMHSFDSALRRINKLVKGRETFMNLSRMLAKEAQKREYVTRQPKEKLNGEKATLTIKNYLGGYYYFTADEVQIHNNTLFIIEGKHTKTNKLPSLEDIKDGLLKMILFTNLKDVKIQDKKYKSVAVLKLTTGPKFKISELKNKQKQILNLLKEEAKTNNFKILINNRFLS